MIVNQGRVDSLLCFGAKVPLAEVLQHVSGQTIDAVGRGGDTEIRSLRYQIGQNSDVEIGDPRLVTA